MGITVDSTLGAPDEPRAGSAERDGSWVRTVLAAVSVGAGVIHLAMVPSHAGGSTLEAVGFAAFGWAQILVGLWVALRRSPPALPALAAVHLAALGLWAWSRTAGLPFGAHPDEAAAVTAVDGLAAAFAAVGGLGACVLMVLPGLGRRAGSMGMAFAGAAVASALLGTSLALASPAARDHAATHEHADAATASLLGAGAESVAGHPHPTLEAAVDPSIGVVASAGAASAAGLDAHGHPATAAPAATVAVEDRCDVGFNPVAYWEETATAGIDTVGGSHGTAAGHDHAAVLRSIEGSADLDRLVAMTTADGAEGKDARIVVELAEVTDEVYAAWLAWLPTYTAAAHGTSVSADDNGGHGGHLGPQPWVAMTDQAECDRLAAELERSRAVALQYPTAADATAAGWYRVTGYVPGIAAHYMNFRLVDGTFDIDEPEMLLYDGDGPDANIVGVSHYLIHESDYEPTQGFTGPNDHFHRHIGLCVGTGGVIGDSATTEEECAAQGGRKQSASGGWMNHVWIVPGCESPWGMFSGASPLLDGSMRSVSGTDGGACAGSSVRDRYDLGGASVEQVQALLTTAGPAGT